MESKKVNEAQGMRPDPYPLGAAIDYLGKRPATLSDPILSLMIWVTGSKIRKRNLLNRKGIASWVMRNQMGK